jgi:hypothetical protein
MTEVLRFVAALLGWLRRSSAQREAEILIFMHDIDIWRAALLLVTLTVKTLRHRCPSSSMVRHGSMALKNSVVLVVWA